MTRQQKHCRVEDDEAGGVYSAPLKALPVVEERGSGSHFCDAVHDADGAQSQSGVQRAIES
jgi:hypothetical protein